MSALCGLTILLGRAVRGELNRNRWPRPRVAEHALSPGNVVPSSALMEGNIVDLVHSPNREAIEQPVDLTSSTPRRRFLARLIALPAALGVAVLVEREPAAGKKNKKKKKHNKGGDGGGGGGSYSPDSEERAFLDLINDYRNQKGVGALSLQDQLGAASEFHSQDMAQKNYFNHRLSNGDSPEQNMERFGYTNWTHTGENIAAGTNYDTAREVMKAWQDSPEHNKNMLNGAFKEIGIGRAFDANSKYGWYWTTDFGTR
jgi:uncharacterized protein YkwD